MSVEEKLSALSWGLSRSGEPSLICDAQLRVLHGAAGSAAESFPEPFRETAIASCRRALQSAAEQRFEWGETSAAGVRSWYACTVTPLVEEGAPVGLLLRSADVTALKKQEERLRRSEAMMVDTQGVAHLGTWEWDISQPTAVWSDELYRIYGLTPETYTPTYEQYLTKVHEEDRQRVIDATNAVFHQHVPYSHDERVFRPDGSIRHLHTWAFPVLDEQGKLTRLVGVCQDITDRKQAEEQVLALNRDLELRVAERTRTVETQVKDLEAFNAMVSHDLRAPLQTIQLGCAVLEKAGLPAGGENTLQRIRSSATRMAQLLDDLLKLSRVAHGPLGKQPVDLTALAEETLATLRRADPLRTVETRVQPGLSSAGDPGLLRAALENLLGNAWKYSSKVPSALIEVGAAEEPRTFFVRDNGAGFDMAHSGRLFNAFQRLHDAAEFAGTGVGLAAVHRIIERHGGRIWAEAQPGKGASFFFQLPA